MCPVCVANAANAAMAAGGAVSSGGAAAFAFRMFRAKWILKTNRWKNSTKRRNENGYTGEQERVSESRVAS